MGTLINKTVFVTGISQGIVAAIAETLFSEGCTVSMHYFSSNGLAMSPIQFGLSRFKEAGDWFAAIKFTTVGLPSEAGSTLSGISNSGEITSTVSFMVIGVLAIMALWFVYSAFEKKLKESGARVVAPLKLQTNKFVFSRTFSSVFIDVAWYFITFWIGRYLASTYGWSLATIGLLAVFPFIVTYFGNSLPALFTRLTIRRGVPILKASKVSELIVDTFRKLKSRFKFEALVLKYIDR